MNFKDTLDDTIRRIDVEINNCQNEPLRAELLKIKVELMKAWALKCCSDQFYRIG